MLKTMKILCHQDKIWQSINLINNRGNKFFWLTEIRCL